MNNNEPLEEQEDILRQGEGDDEVAPQINDERPPLNQDPDELVMGDMDVGEEEQDDLDKWFAADDIYVYSGEISGPGADVLIGLVEEEGVREKGSLILTTNGGDPDAAYRIARCFRRKYKVFSLYVFGDCKSAGTLLALGAHRIVMAPTGEFGPLDVQLLREDDNIIMRRSGLDVFQTLAMLRNEAFRLFESQFIEILGRSYGAITTKTAGELATAVTVGLLSPITAQIDPFKLGEMQRSVNIARDYGYRLNENEKLVDSLIHEYPSHSFVIDCEEAKDLFANVYDPKSYETGFLSYLAGLFVKNSGYNIIRYPSTRSPIITILNALPDQEEEYHDEPENLQGAEAGNNPANNQND